MDHTRPAAVRTARSTYTPGVSSAVPVLQVVGLGTSFGTRTALDDVDLTVVAGTTTVLLGPNGAGKTTLVRCCTGLLTPDRGSVTVCGRTATVACAEGRVGLMPQSAGAWSGIRAGELLQHLAGFHRSPLPLAPLVARLGLEPSLRTPYRRLSGGQQQAVNLIGAIVGRPELVFLDEPTAGMDPRARRTTWDLIAELASAGVGVLLTTHDMTEAETLGDDVVIIDHGSVRAHGTVAALTSGGADLESVFLAATAEGGAR